jgi:hypothetical protein
VAIRTQLSAVSRKPKNAKRRPGATPSPITLVVRRGALRRFHLLKKKAASLGLRLIEAEEVA